VGGKGGALRTSFVVCRVFQKTAIGQHKVDQYGAPLNEQEWGEEAGAARELVHAGEAASSVPDGLMIAAAGERDDMQSYDFEQVSRFFLWMFVVWNPSSSFSLQLLFPFVLFWMWLVIWVLAFSANS